MLKEVAEKRLHAIREYSDLGSGFKIAMRDMEIRGVGTLLGQRQHGHMQAVGYNLYCKMLSEAVARMKGGQKPDLDDFETVADIQKAIVYSGTKLNIDYFLDEAMDEDHLLDIYDYFKESETDSLSVAMDELGDDYTEEEVRLVRIKFISEMAN